VAELCMVLEFIANVDGGLDTDGGTRWFYGERDMEICF